MTVEKKLGQGELTVGALNLAGGDLCKTKCKFYNTCNSECENRLKKALTDLLGTLTDAEQAVLKLRCGFCDNKQLSYSEIGDRLGLTPERVRQILSLTSRKLRHPARRHFILDGRDAFCAANADFYEDLIAAVYKLADQAAEC